MTAVRLGSIPNGGRIRLPRGQVGTLVERWTARVVVVRLDVPRPPHVVGPLRVLSSGLVRVRNEVLVEELDALDAA